MSEWQPIDNRLALETVDESDCIAGYWAGRNNEPEPGSDKSKSFWHGWRNGRSDFGHAPIDEAQRELAAQVVRSWNAH